MNNRVLPAASAALLLLALGACAQEKSSSPPPLQPQTTASGSAAADPCAKESLATQSEGTLTIGTDKPAYEPWFNEDDPTSGKGYESAVAYAVAEQLGFAKTEVTWITAPFNSVATPGRKKFDLDINQVSITDERKQVVDFSSGYYDVTQAVIARKDSPIADATTVAELKKAKLGGQIGTTSYQTLVDVVDPSEDVAAFRTNDIAKAALKNGQIDGLAVDLPTAFYITAAEIPEAKIVGQFPAQPGGEQFGLVLEKGSPLTPCVTQAVDALREDGTLADLQTQWLASTVGAPVFAE